MLRSDGCKKVRPRQLLTGSTAAPNDPLVSVVIPTYNRRDLLAEAMESVRQQTISKWELIVVDDGSTDGTWVWLCEQEDVRLRTLHLHANSGRNTARNSGLAEAVSPFVFFLDDDDLLVPSALNKMLDSLMHNPSCVAAIAGREYFGEWSGKTSWPKRSMVRNVFWDAFFGLALGGADILYRKAPLRAVGGLPEGIELREDWVGGLRVARQGNFAIIPDRLVLKRMREDQRWSEPDCERTMQIFRQDAERWFDGKDRRRLDHALVALNQLRGVQNLPAGTPFHVICGRLMLAIATFPPLLKATLFWRLVGPGIVKSTLPPRVRNAIRRGRTLLNSKDGKSSVKVFRGPK